MIFGRSSGSSSSRTRNSPTTTGTATSTTRCRRYRDLGARAGFFTIRRRGRDSCVRPTGVVRALHGRIWLCFVSGRRERFITALVRAAQRAAAVPFEDP
jgi:hypothetical protein